MGFIDIGDGVKKKITELEEQNKLLQDRLNECIERCEKLEREKRDLENYYRGDSIVGDPFE